MCHERLYHTQLVNRFCGICVPFRAPGCVVAAVHIVTEAVALPMPCLRLDRLAHFHLLVAFELAFPPFLPPCLPSCRKKDKGKADNRILQVASRWRGD